MGKLIDLSNQMVKKNNQIITKKSSIVLVIIFTIFTTIAQMCMKLGAMDGYFNMFVFFAFFFYGVGTLIFIIALRNGELSVLYPFISLGFIWVFIVSVILFNESISLQKIFGLCCIISGVSILGVKK